MTAYTFTTLERWATTRNEVATFYFL